jgi:predicted nucleic acid-binding protein
MPTVSNTSPISNLAIIEKLDLLFDQFSQVFIPRSVFEELSRMTNTTARNLVLQAVEAGWLVVRHAISADTISLLLASLHRGEAEAITLALDIRAELLLMDESDGRRIAREYGVPVRGILGILLRARKTGRVSAIKPYIEMLKKDAKFFIASDLEKSILAAAGES